ncbi:MAG TPA: MFS transporter [Anaerolineales bacterium]|nr:MFS transporter [Anaerolineales bacterium]HNB35578.1 MFS transporter [Anaerolineales bacterium]HNC07172.1 MFS transporter [Anaerolineales bacterium]
MPIFFDSLFSFVALSHFMVDTFNASRPVLLTYFGLSESQIALFSTIYIWASALTQPFFGWLSDRTGPRWLAAGGVLWMTIFYSGAIFFPGNLGLICLIIAALGSSAFHPVGAVQAALRGRDLMKGRETTSTSLFFMAGQLGHFAGPIITGLILASLKIPGMYILPIVSIPIGMTLMYQLRDNHPHPKPAGSGAAVRAKVGLTFILVLAVVAALQSWAQSNMVNLIPKYIKDLGQGATVYGSMAGLFMGGSALGNVIGGYLGDRFPKRFIASGVLLLAAFPIYITSLVGWSGWLYVLVPLAGAFTGAVHSIMVVLAQRIIPGGMALASGLVLGFIFSSGALGLLYTGHLAELYGFPYVLTLTTGMVLVASPLALLLKE